MQARISGTSQLTYHQLTLSRKSLQLHGLNTASSAQASRASLFRKVRGAHLLKVLPNSEGLHMLQAPPTAETGGQCPCHTGASKPAHVHPEPCLLRLQNKRMLSCMPLHAMLIIWQALCSWVLPDAADRFLETGVWINSTICYAAHDGRT